MGGPGRNAAHLRLRNSDRKRCGLKMTNAVKQRLSQLRALLDILDQRREKANGEHTADLQEKIYAIELAIAHYEAALIIERRIARLEACEGCPAGLER